MNAERLHVIALAIQDDYTSTKVENTLQLLRDSLQNQVNQPGQVQHQKQVSTYLQQLRDALSKAPSEEFSPTWKQIVIEIGGEELIGKKLLRNINDIFERNQITLAVAQQELSELHSKVYAFKKAIDSLVTSFETLNIGSEELKSGETELGILIPRIAVNNELCSFGSELKELHKILGAFSELSIGTRPGFEIRTISSTDLSVFLSVAPQVAACIAVAVERIIAFYKNLLEIRKLRSELVSQGLSKKELSGVESHANNVMSDGIEKLIEELIEKYAGKIKDGRKNELRNELRYSLNHIANRIDRGFNIEIRVKPLEEPSDDEETQVDQALQSSIDIAFIASKGLKFLRTEGEPILSLPEPEEIAYKDEKKK